MEDKLLVLRCKHGSGEALCRIYEKYKADLLVLAMALLNEKTAAEDVVHHLKNSKISPKVVTFPKF